MTFKDELQHWHILVRSAYGCVSGVTKYQNDWPDQDILPFPN